MAKREFAKSNALGDRSTDAIYLEDQVVSRFVRATGHPGWHGRHVVGIREAVGAWGVRLGLSPVTMLPPAAGEPEAGFLGTVTSGKLPKVKEKPTVASIWAVTLAEKTTPVLATIELDV